MNGNLTLSVPRIKKRKSCTFQEERNWRNSDSRTFFPCENLPQNTFLPSLFLKTSSVNQQSKNFNKKYLEENDFHEEKKIMKSEVRTFWTRKDHEPNFV